MAISSVSFIQYPSSLTITTETNNSVLITKGYADGILGSVATEWSATTFTAGQIVSYNGKLYKAENDTSASDIPGASNNWDEYDFTNILSDASTDITLSSGTPEYITVSGSTISLSGSKGVTSSGGNTSDASKIVILGEDGKINSNMLPAIAITDTTVGTTAPSTKQKGDVWIDTANSKSYIWDGSAWKELLSPVDGVVSINGNSGILTLGASDVGAIASSALVTSVSSSSTDATVPSALSVYSFVNNGYTAKGHTHTSANISDSVSAATGVTSTASGLAQAKAIYDYAAPKSHTHTSGNISDSISTSGAITSTETKLVQAKAVYSYIDGLALGTTYAAKSHTHTSANISDSISTSGGITSTETKLVQAKAVYSYIDGLSLGTTYAAKSHTHTSANISDSVSADTGITSTATGLVQAKAVYAYAAPKTHKHTSANISDAITEGTGVTSTETKVTQAKAVYEYVGSAITALDLANTYAAKSHTHSNYSTTSHTHTSDKITDAIGAGTGITATETKLTKALAVYEFVNSTISGLDLANTYAAKSHTHSNYAASSHTHTSDKITDSVSADTGITSTETKLVQAKAVYAYAAPKTHNHTSANISDAITAGTGITSTETKLTEAKAVYEYVGSAISALDLANTYAAKSHTHNYAASSHTHTSDKITDAITAGTGITSTETKLTEAKAVYEYVASAISALDLANTYAAKSHTHSNYSTTSHTHTSDKITDAITAGTGITSTETKLVQAKAVYEYASPTTHTHTSDKITDSISSSSNITSSASGLVQGKAVYNLLSNGSALVKFKRLAFTVSSSSPITSKSLTHSLGTKDLIVQVMKDNVPVLCDWTATSTSAITLNFAQSISSGSFVVMIIAFPSA